MTQHRVTGRARGPRHARLVLNPMVPSPSLRELAQLVAEAVQALLPAQSLVTSGSLLPALAGGGGITGVAMSDGSPQRVHAIDSSIRVSLPTRRPSPFPSTNDKADEKSPVEFDHAVEEDHAETWSLVVAAQAGDGEAFGKLYDRYVDAVYRFIYYRVNDRALAEDFTSETFLRALRRISGINYQGRDIGAWFMTIARNIVFDHSKSARFRLEMMTGEVVEPGEVEASTESAVLAHLTNERLMQAVDTLNDEQKECIVLRFLHGFSVAETAEVMGKNDGAIKALQHRAVKRLAALVADELR